MKKEATTKPTEQGQLPLVVASFDPGKTTGYTILRAGRTKNNAPRVMRSGTFTTHRFLASLFKSLEKANGARFVVVGIIIEDFKIYPSSIKHLIWNNVVAARWIGAVQQTAYEHGFPITSLQMPFMRKEMLKHPIVRKVKNKHARDSCAHALHWLVKRSYWNGRMR